MFYFYQFENFFKFEFQVMANRRRYIFRNSATERICFWVIWLKWKFLALACNGFQSRDVVITHSRYEAVEASLWPHPSIFISLLYSTGLSHVRTEVLVVAAVAASPYSRWCRLFAAWFFLCRVLLLVNVSADRVIE